MSGSESLQVVVNGQPTEVEFIPDEPVRSFMSRALARTGNLYAGLTLDDWFLGTYVPTGPETSTGIVMKACSTMEAALWRRQRSPLYLLLKKANRAWQP